MGEAGPVADLVVLKVQGFRERPQIGRGRGDLPESIVAVGHTLGIIGELHDRLAAPGVITILKRPR